LRAADPFASACRPITPGRLRRSGIVTNRAAALRLPGSHATILMIPMPLLTFVLLAAEIALLIKLGQVIGGGLLLAEILISGAVGMLLLRASGRKLFDSRRLIALLVERPDLRSRDPILSLVYGGLLLLIPGLLSDLAGFVLVMRYALRGGRFSPPRADRGGSGAIDIDFEVQDNASENDASEDK